MLGRVVVNPKVSSDREGEVDVEEEAEVVVAPFGGPSSKYCCTISSMAWCLLSGPDGRSKSYIIGLPESLAMRHDVKPFSSEVHLPQSHPRQRGPNLSCSYPFPRIDQFPRKMTSSCLTPTVISHWPLSQPVEVVVPDRTHPSTPVRSFPVKRSLPGRSFPLLVRTAIKLR